MDQCRAWVQEVEPQSKYISINNTDILLPKNKNDLGTMQGWIGHCFEH